MLRKSGGCATAAYALTVGLGAGPTVKLRTEMLEGWLQVLAETSAPKEAIKRAWNRARPGLVGPKRCLKVRGPMATVIATLWAT